MLEVFAKAFDKVDHGILLAKLEKIGIGGKLLQWLRVFLTNRVQQVRVLGHLSAPRPVISGVPQGSVLGPLLFLIMILDINKEVTAAEIGSFADDTKTWRAIKCINDEAIMQQELNKLYQWGDDNNMTYNDTKFDHLEYGRSPSVCTEYYYVDVSIKKKDTVKDLGIHFSTNARFTEHIHKTVAEANRISGYVLRTFRTRKTYLMGTLLRSLIVSKLEYGCVLWSPTDPHLIKLIESVQRRFTSRFVEFNEFSEELGIMICVVDYWERINRLRIFSLERRRERYMIFYIFKIIIGLCPNPGFDRIPMNRRTTIMPKHSGSGTADWVKSVRQSSFFVRAPQIYNTLPEALRNVIIPETPSKLDVDEYKKKLDPYLWHIPDQPGSVEGESRQGDTNSLLHMTQYYQQETLQRNRV